MSRRSRIPFQERQPMALAQRLAPPTANDVKKARKSAGLTQEQAALLVSPAESRPYRTWQNYETPEGQDGHRAIPLGLWELFLLLTDQHPLLEVHQR